MYVADFQNKVIYHIYGEVTANGTLVVHETRDMPKAVNDFLLKEIRSDYPSLVIGSKD